jgi:hypothetical protein
MIRASICSSSMEDCFGSCLSDQRQLRSSARACCAPAPSAGSVIHEAAEHQFSATRSAEAFARCAATRRISDLLPGEFCRLAQRLGGKFCRLIN